MTATPNLSPAWKHWYQRILPAYWVFLFCCTHFPRLSLDTGLPNQDKLLHICAFAILSFLWFRCRQTLDKPITGSFAPGIAMWLLVYAAIDEYTQLWFGRAGGFYDWLADCSGGLTVIFLLELDRRGVFRSSPIGRVFNRIGGWVSGPSLSSITAEDDEAAYRPIDLKLLRRMLAWLAPYRGRYALGILIGLAMVVLEMQSPLFIAHIVNYATSFLGKSLQPQPTLEQATWHVVLIVLLWASLLATALVLERFTILVMTSGGERVQFDIRRALFEHLQRLSMSYFDRTKLGRIVSRCTSDVSSMRDMNVWGIYNLAKNLLMMIVAAAMLLWTEPRLFLAVAWLGPVLFMLNRVYRRRIGVAHQIAREGYTRVATNMAENITGVRVVTAFNRQLWNLGSFNTLQDDNTRNNVNVARITGVYQPMLQVVGFMGKVIILLFGGYLVATGGIRGGVGAVVAAFLYWDWFMNPILTFGTFHNQLMQALAGGERIMNLLDQKPEVVDTPDAQPLPAIQGHVRFEHVTFAYLPDRPVLHDIDFEVQPGEVVALVGPTGGGKSSIISLLARFYQPQLGRVLIDGHDIRQVTGDSLHRQMGLVLQTNFLFTGTVMDNIRYARPEASDEEVIAAARAIASYDAIATLAQGFRTEVGERGASLSLGQRQLVCFTRAFLADPRIFILDEATSAVDSATELAVQRSLEKLCEGRTTFIVAHRLSTIVRADSILLVDAGRIVERGTHRELLAADGRYARLYEQFAAAQSA